MILQELPDTDLLVVYNEQWPKQHEHLEVYNSVCSSYQKHPCGVSSVGSEFKNDLGEK